MNVPPMIFRFRSGSVTPASAARNLSDASSQTSGRCMTLGEALPDLCGLVHPQQAVVDEDAREAVADRPVREQRRHRRIHAAAQPADHAAGRTDLLANALGRFVDEGGHRPVAGASAHAGREVREDARPVLGMRDLRMEQQRVQAASRIGHARHRRIRAGRDDGEAGRSRFDDVAVTRPHPNLVRHPFEQAARLPHRDRCMSVLAFRRVADRRPPGAAVIACMP